ncbi:MAG TPA: carboxypeptidase-like regulatory domain-containing protein [Thermoanaerobaculia bacterium]|nr:carboxypeptidase-like regulatory domain-containing protein [Thermoanaerobaculia bacterium]
MTVPGERTFDLPVGGTWRLEAQAEGFWAEEQIVLPGKIGQDVIRLRLFPTGVLKARIEPPRGESPPTSLAVRLQPAPGTGGKTGLPKEATLSCPVREAVWECAVPAGRLDLRIKSEGLIPVYQWGVGVEPGKKKDLGALSLRRGASVAGWVQLEGGEPPARPVRVALSPQAAAYPDTRYDAERLRSLAWETRTNERGFFQLEGVTPGSYVVTASDAELAPARVSPVVVREGLQAEILDPIVLARPVSLEVVLDPPLDPYGQPWKLQLYPEQAPDASVEGSWKGTASEEGRWTQAGLAPGDYQLSVVGDLESRWAHQEIRLERGGPPVFVEIPVVWIQGKVTLGDEPLAATLWFGGRSGERRIRFDADEKGRFEGVLPEEGTWSLALASEEKELQLSLKPVQVKRLPGKRAASVDIRVPDTTLAGEVVDDKGRKVPGAQVSVIREGTHLISTDEDGEFEFRGIEPGLAGVEAQEQDRTSGMVEVTVSEDRDAPRLRLVLRQATQVRGRVSSSAGPVPGAELLAFPSVSDVPFAAGVEAVTRADGSFILSFPANVQAFHLTVLAPGYAFRMLPVVVERGKALEVPVETSGGTLVLEMPGLRREGPQPLLAHNGTFTPLPLLSRWLRLQRVQSRDPGRIVIPNMEAGDYSVCRNAGLELRQGKEPPGDRCVSGFLPPHGELVLRLGGGSDKKEEASPVF